MVPVLGPSHSNSPLNGFWWGNHALSDLDVTGIPDFDWVLLQRTLDALQADGELNTTVIDADFLMQVKKELGEFEDQESFNGIPVDNLDDEWDNMPEFNQKNLMQYRDIIVHFLTPEDLQAFCNLVGQQVTDKTKYIWFPKQEINKVKHKRYE